MLLSLFIAAGLFSALAWTYLLLFHGGFWRVRRHLLARQPWGNVSSVAVVIPARDEAGVIVRAIASLLQQTWPGALHISLVDDDSRDGTAEVARAAAARAGKSDALTVISGRPLPAGWSGKLWAVQQGIERALAANPDFLLLTDADVEHAPDSVATLVAAAEGAPYDLVSLMVKLHCAGRAERLLVPAFVFFFFKLYPPAWIADRNRASAGAAGGCMLIRPEALARAGGIAAVRGEVIDDCALAAVVKRSGGRLYLGLTPDTASIRPYGSFAGIGRMIARTAFNQLHHSTLLLLGAIIGMALLYLAPVVLLFSGRLVPALLGAFAWLLMTVCFLPMVRFYGLNPLWAITLPASALFYMGATIHSALRFWSGRGGEWKGRAQDVAREK